ncbi:hypothetical protein EJD97_005479, partial [Solanum chilense]
VSPHVIVHTPMIRIRKGQGVNLSWGYMKKLFNDGAQVHFEIASNQRFYPYFKAKPEAADLRTKSIRNYDKLMMLYGKDRASGKHADTGPDMLKRGTNKNLKRSSTSSLTIEEADEMISMNDASLENTEGDKLDEQSQPINDALKSDVSSKVPTHERNKKSKHNHFEGMADMLRGGMDKLAHAINLLSTMPPISQKRELANDKRDEFEISYELKGLYIYLSRCKYVSHIDWMFTEITQVSFIDHDAST